MTDFSTLRRLKARWWATDEEVDRTNLTRLLILGLVAVPIVFNTVNLIGELTSGAPSQNDDAFQSMLVRTANAAIAAGRNPVDYWQASLELGFPQFLYYQNAPHLFVVGLSQIFGSIASPFDLFNVVRFVLLVTFPATVFWSTRRMGFSLVAAGIAAAASSLISGDTRYGFEYDSYIWRGFGMFTQLWAMHLTFITLACAHRVLTRGKGYLPAIVAFALLALSHLIYAYMMAITLLLLVIVGGDLRALPTRFARMAIVSVAALAIASYMLVPFLQSPEYLNASPYLQSWKYDSFGGETILGWLFSGDLLDHGRLPVLSVLLASGVITGIIRPTRLRFMATVGLVVWLVLYFGRPTLGFIADLFPLHNGLLFHRFIGEFELFAIIVIGIGGESLWRVIATWRPRGMTIGGSSAWLWRPIAAAGVIVVVLTPAMLERASYYKDNSVWMTQTRAALDADTDLQTIVATIKAQPFGGRTYAGLRTNWGNGMLVGPFVKVTDILTFNDIPVVAPPYQSLSLNSDLIWWFKDGDLADFDAMDVRYVIAPASFTVPAFYKLLTRTGRYALYRIPTSGMAEYVAIGSRQSAPSQRALFDANLAWWQGSGPDSRIYIRWDYGKEVASGGVSQGCPNGASDYERDEFDAVHLVVRCPTAATLILKTTYHPNWRVTVDGQDVSTFMVSPSYIGIELAAGTHTVDAQYQPSPLKTPLLIFGLLVVAGVAVTRRRLDVIPSQIARAMLKRAGQPGARPSWRRAEK